MNIEFKQLHLTLICCLSCVLNFAQVQEPKTPTPATFEVITPSTSYAQHSIQSQTTFQTSQPNGMNVYEQDKKRVEQQQNELKQLQADLINDRINYSLPSYENIESSKHYRDAFKKLNVITPNNFSIKDVIFTIENAYLEEQQSYSDFDDLVKQTGNFLREKMNELSYDTNSNLAKNFILFQFFSDTLEIQSKNLKHLPFEYDFEDYMGVKDWSKMFVSKLLATRSGQCNSLPTLYLILAEEIGAEAYLSLSPNHSYIRFRDENEYWYNVELTNGMFTTDSFILQSGFIKSEALQNGIYMQNLSSEQLMAQLLTNLALGYIHKFGYDSFVKEIIDKALSLYPNLINARMVNANYLTVQFEYAMKQAGINPRDKMDLQNIRQYPQLVKMLNEVNNEYQQIDDLGFELMPAHAYEKWLNSLQDIKQKQDNKHMAQQFKNVLNKPLKD